jgi:hypothetical protein
MNNLLCFDLLMPSNTKIINCTHSPSVLQITPLKRIEEKNPIGCFIPKIKLEENHTYELHILGKVTTTDKSVYLTIEDYKINRIQDPSGKIINLLYRFKNQKERIINLFIGLVTMSMTMTMTIDTSKSYLYIVGNNEESLLMRRGESLSSSLDNCRVRSYSLAHTVFDRIYILNFDHEPHKWIQCRNILKRAGIYGTRIEMSISSELATYLEWQKKSYMVKMTIEQWCITKTIINVICNDAKPLVLERILFFKDDMCMSDTFETELYNSLMNLKTVEWKLFSCGSGLGFSASIYDEVVSKFNISPVPINKLFKDLSVDNVQHLVCAHSAHSVPYAHVALPSHYITLIVHVPRRQFFFDSSNSTSALYKLLSLIRLQNYPWYNCILLTECLPSSTATLRLEVPYGKDSRFRIIEKKDPEASTARDIFGMFFPSKYLATFHILSDEYFLLSVSDPHCFSKHIYAHSNGVSFSTSTSTSTSGSGSGSGSERFKIINTSSLDKGTNITLRPHTLK